MDTPELMLRSERNSNKIRIEEQLEIQAKHQDNSTLMARGRDEDPDTSPSIWEPSRQGLNP